MNINGWEMTCAQKTIDGLDCHVWRSVSGAGYFAEYRVSGAQNAEIVPGSGAFDSLEQAMEACATQVALVQGKRGAALRAAGSVR